MTIGEKIKYYRTQLGLTQKQLAELTSIHLVSIKKYETNKMQPQLAQVERIASALGVGTNALLNLDDLKLRCHTIADFMGILLLLNNSELIAFNGIRNDDGILNPDTLTITFTKNPLMDKLLKITTLNPDLNISNIGNLSIEITDSGVRENIVKWEKMITLYRDALYRKEQQLDEQDDNLNNEILLLKEKFELELMRSMYPLNPNE